MQLLPVRRSSKFGFVLQVGQPALALSGAHGVDQFAYGFPEAVGEGIHDHHVRALIGL